MKAGYWCLGGPMNGDRVWLHGDAKSLLLELHGQCGRYVPHGSDTVRWEPLEEFLFRNSERKTQ